jgi:hypothetical protein
VSDPNQQEPQEPRRKPTMTGLSIQVINDDGTTGVRAFFFWNVGGTTEAELRQAFGQLTELAVQEYRKRNGMVLN